MLRSASLAAALLIPALPVTAQTIAASDPDSVLQAIRAHGHKAKLDRDGEGYPVIQVDRSGINYSVYFYGCNGDPTACQDIQFASGFDVEEALSGEWANEWNRQWVAGRVEVNADGDPRLTYFVTTGGGLSAENFRSVMGVWDVTLNGFMEDIGW
jgi:hypothetical protein